MRSTLKLATAFAATAAFAGMNATSASAGDSFSFPSSNGVAVATSTPQFAAPAAPEAGAQSGVGTSLGFGLPKAGDKLPLPIYAPEMSRLDGRARGGDAFVYHLLTHALASQSFSNYAADYARLFAPNYAVTAWTDRVSGLVEGGYGGAIDSWTAGAYYLGRVRGPNIRRNSPPDLSTIPTFRAHPELETHPTFQND